MRAQTPLGMAIPVRYLPYKYHLWLELACSVIILAFLAILAVKGYELTLLNIERTFGDSTLSYGWVTAAVPVGCVLIGASLVYNMVHAFRRRRQGALVYSRTAIDKPLSVSASAEASAAESAGTVMAVGAVTVARS